MKKSRLPRLVFLLLVPPLYLGILGVALVRWGNRDCAQRADAILIFGARVRPDGSASPILQARTRHAYTLWKKKLAPLIVCTGGVGDYPPAESVVQKQLLERWGVPSDVILVEATSTSTRQNAANAAALLPRGAHVIAVSEAFHLWRARHECVKLGLVAVTSPETPGWNKLSWHRKAFYALREAVLVTRDLFSG